MRTFKTLTTGLITVAAVALLIGCGGDQSQTETTTQEQSQPATQTQTAEATSAKAYPLDYCIVSGEKLGSMGDPVVKTYQGREVKFCCQMCVPDFESNVVMYLAKIDSAAAGTTDMPGHEGHDHSGDGQDHDHSGHDHSHGG
ncbi:MAG: hypothetical protein GF341_01380 [candidate division Zixibacteria bacterium]|nr:hypothetical protein [candidate division Zixibacteria bacterium]